MFYYPVKKYEGYLDQLRFYNQGCHMRVHGLKGVHLEIPSHIIYYTYSLYYIDFLVKVFTHRCDHYFIFYFNSPYTYKANIFNEHYKY